MILTTQTEYGEQMKTAARIDETGKQTVAERIKAIVEDSDLWVFGVRNLHDDEDVAVGTIMAESVVWDDGDRIEDEPIGGTCCWSLDEYCGNVDAAIARAEKYTLSGRYALLGGKYCGNNDLIAEPHAVAIRDAVVLLVW